MKRKLSTLLALGTLAVAASPSAKAALLLYYDFNGLPQGTVADGTSIANSAGAPGTLDTGTDGGNIVLSVASGIPGGLGGNALQLTPATDGLANLAAPNINTGSTALALSVTGSTDYTAMAWVNFASATGDNMVFGQDNVAAAGGGVLHNGSRGGNLHSGHWGDDLGPDQGVFVNSQPGTWHHVAWTNDATTQAQQIYFDGILVAGPGAGGAAGAMDVNQLLLIGTSGNGGSFNGQLDEVKIYNTLLTQTEIKEASIIPEPAGIALLAMWGVAATMRRRRRAAR